jgi:mono/diheme cytochrome c family protein
MTLRMLIAGAVSCGVERSLTVTKRARLVLGGLIAAVLIALGATAVGAQGPTPAAAPPPSARPSAVRGQELFSSNCVPCHGQKGRGDGATLQQQGMVAPSFAGTTFHNARTPAEMYTVISEGRIAQLMPPWKGRLTTDQMWDVAYYSWWVGTSPRSLARGQTLWQAGCASCHGPNGAAASGTDLSRATQTIGRSQADLANAMPSTAGHDGWTKLSPADQLAVLDYTRSLGFDAPPLPALNGVVLGTIRNGTPGATLTAGQVVTATLYTVLGNSFDGVITATVGSDASFKFDSLVADGEYSYGVGARYGGVDYFSGLVAPTPTEPQRTTTLMVYETTTTDPGIRVARVHVVADFADGQTLRVGELYQVENQGQRTLVAPADGSTFDLPLPQGAVNVRFQDETLGNRAMRDGDTLRMSIPWTPGSRQVLLSYDLPYPGQTTLTRSFPYPAADVTVLIPDVGVRVQATGLETRAATPARGGSFLTFGAQGVPARQPIALRISGAPAATGGADPSGGVTRPPAARVQTSYQLGMRWLAVVFAALALVSVALWPRFAPSLARLGTAGEAGAMREELLDRLAELDDAYAEGKVAEVEYTMRRAELKARLTAVMRTLRAEE